MLERPACRPLSILAALLALAVPPTVNADSIHLRGSVRLPAGLEAVRLADIADLTGPDAERHADLVVAQVTDASTPFEVALDQVRAALTDAGVHWGRVNLSGRLVIVRPGRQPEAASAPAAMTAVSLPSVDAAIPAERHDADDLVAASVIDEATLRGGIARWMVSSLSVDPEDLRLLFDRADRESLALTDAGTSLEITPAGNEWSDRVNVGFRAWSGGRVDRVGSISLRPLMRRPVAVLRRDVDRDEVIDETALMIEQQWLAPAEAQMMCVPTKAVGRCAARKLHAGDAIRDTEVRRAVLIERGDRVNIRCRVGGIVITLVAEARSEGAEGETIEFRKLGERHTVFVATVVDRGEAVVDLGR